jgi:signal transduction histidine kinase
MAMELHDMTSPIYTSLLRQIEDVEIPDSGIKDELLQSLTMLADRIRKISHKMGGVHVNQLTFNEIVEGFCEEMQYRTDAQIKLYLPRQEIVLSVEKATNIIRIIQELVTNGVKYVKTGEISLSISVELENIHLIYHDTGPGFEMEATNATGLGLANIFERAKLLGGKAFLESAPLKGTHWTIRVPFLDHKK